MTARASLIVLAAIGCSETNHAHVVEPLSATTEEDKSLRLTVIATDVDGDDLQMTVFPPGGGTLTTHELEQTREGGTTRLEVVLGLRPQQNYHGETGFTVNVRDGEVRTDEFIEVAITPVNDKPEGAADTLAASANTPLAIFPSTLLANDRDVDADVEDREATELQITAVKPLYRGSVTLADGTLMFVPEAGFSGTASFEYRLSDGLASVPVTVLVAVAGPNAAPVAVDDQRGVIEGQVLRLAPPALTKNDVDQDAQALAVIAVDNATHGTVQVNAGIVTFTPEEGYYGLGGFDYTVTDGVGTDTGHVDVMISPLI
jgi:hypothetical protein